MRRPCWTTIARQAPTHLLDEIAAEVRDGLTEPALYEDELWAALAMRYTELHNYDAALKALDRIRGDLGLRSALAQMADDLPQHLVWGLIHVAIDSGDAELAAPVIGELVSHLPRAEHAQLVTVGLQATAHLHCSDDRLCSLKALVPYASTAQLETVEEMLAAMDPSGREVEQDELLMCIAIRQAELGHIADAIEMGRHTRYAAHAAVAGAAIGVGHRSPGCKSFTNRTKPHPARRCWETPPLHRPGSM